MIISFVNQKGGVGKTTTAINFAASLARKNSNLVVVDADPQASVFKWHQVEGNRAFEVLHQPGGLNLVDMETLNESHDYVVIDTPPAVNEITQTILAASDIAVVPVSPSALDIWSTKGTLEMIEAAQSRNPDLEVKFLINRKIPGTRVGREVREALKEFQPTILDTELCQRVAYIDAMKCGVSVMQFAPGSKAAAEIELLCEELLVQQAPPSTEDDHSSIADIYQEMTNNILFRSFQPVSSN